MNRASTSSRNFHPPSPQVGGSFLEEVLDSREWHAIQVVACLGSKLARKLGPIICESAAAVWNTQTRTSAGIRGNKPEIGRAGWLGKLASGVPIVPNYGLLSWSQWFDHSEGALHGLCHL